MQEHHLAALLEEAVAWGLEGPWLGRGRQGASKPGPRACEAEGSALSSDTVRLVCLLTTCLLLEAS